MEKLKLPEIRQNFETETAEKLTETKEQIVEKQWNTIKAPITHAASTILGENRKQVKATWFDKECKETIKTRNESYRKCIDEKNKRETTNL